MPPIKILFLADIFGRLGRQGVIKELPRLKKKYQPNLTIANAENLAHGRGVTKNTILEMQDAGIDFFTSGNHVWDKKDAVTILEQKNSPLIRPANYRTGTAGQGEKLLNIGENSILVINLIGRVFISDDYNCPFKQASKILKKYNKENLSGIIIDFHAEATSEKVALGHYLDGQVSAVIGTHTHIQTADEKILEQGTAYITDAGMIGPQDSVIGLEKKMIIKNYLTNQTKSADVPKSGPCIFNAIYLEIDPKIARTKKIQRINKIIKI